MLESGDFAKKFDVQLEQLPLIGGLNLDFVRVGPSVSGKNDEESFNCFRSTYESKVQLNFGLRKLVWEKLKCVIVGRCFVVQ